MDYEKLMKANASAKTTEVKGKGYIEVNERVRIFRMLYPNGSITTDIISLEAGVVVMKTKVCDENGKILATGMAYENETSSFVNKTSYIENCETSAVGRALGMLGIGIQNSIASAEEVTNAIENQKQEEPKPVSNKIDGRMVITLQNEFKKRVNKDGSPINIDSFLKYFKVNTLEDMTVEQYKKAMGMLKATCIEKEKANEN